MSSAFEAAHICGAVPGAPSSEQAFDKIERRTVLEGEDKAGPRAIVERRHHPKPARPRQAALDSLVLHAICDPNPAVRRIVPIAQQDPRALEPRLAGSVRERAID